MISLIIYQYLINVKYYTGCLIDIRIQKLYDLMEGSGKHTWEEGFIVKIQGSNSENMPFLAALPLIHRLVLSGGERGRAIHTKTQLIIFIILSVRESLTMTEIAGYISSSREQATRAVAPLVDAGYVERYVDPQNRTRIHIRLTTAGRAYWEESREKMCVMIDRRLKESLSPEECGELEQATATMIRLLKKIK